MSIPIVFNGVNYEVPEFGDTDYADDLTNFFVAIPNGTLQPNSGTFTLLSELNFGAGFGVRMKYLTIGGAIDPSSVVTLSSTTQGMLAPRMTQIQRDAIASPATGLLIYNTDADQFNYYNGVSWTSIDAGSGSGTVGAGSLNQLAYYPANGTTVSGLTSITANQALRSDANGLPVASTTTSAELAGLHLLTASRAVITDGSGILSTSPTTAAEIAFVSGVTSAIQTQINGKEPTITILPISKGGTNSGTALSNNRVIQSFAGAIVEAAAITASRALISDSNGIPTHSAVTSTELGHVSGVTSAIQTQLDGKADLAGDTFSGQVIVPAGSASTPGIAVGDSANGMYRSATNEVSLSTNGTQRVQIESDGDIFGTTSGSRLATKNTYNNISVTSLGAHDSGTSADITVQNNKTFTVTWGSEAQVFVIMAGGNDTCLVVAGFNNTTITLLGTPGAITATSTPSASQLGIFKSAGQKVVSFKSGTNLTDSGSVIRILSLSGPITAATDWA